MAEAAAEHPFAALVRERGGAPLSGPADAARLDPREVRFVAVLARGEEVLPPVARLGPRQTAAWLLLVADGGSEDGSAGLAEALEAAGSPAYLLTAGRVGGAGDGERSREIPAALVGRVLDAALAGEVDWERDPDFGYELPMELPGLEVDERRVLVPRFLYARTDRVYDYAAMVPRLHRERRKRLESVPALASALVG